LRIAFFASSGTKQNSEISGRALEASAPESTLSRRPQSTVGLSQDTGEAVRKGYPLDQRIGGRILLGVEMNPIGKSA
jgi:hypothetical protein